MQLTAGQNEAFLTYKTPGGMAADGTDESVYRRVESGGTYEHSFTNRQVMARTWDGCEFLSASKWWEVAGKETFHGT